jgi:hypothetical protein
VIFLQDQHNINAVLFALCGKIWDKLGETKDHILSKDE